MNEKLREEITFQSTRFGLPTRCLRDSVDVCVAQLSDKQSIPVQFPLIAYLRGQDKFLESPRSTQTLKDFRTLYELFSNSCVSRVQGYAGDAYVCLHQRPDGVHVTYKI